MTKTFLMSLRSQMKGEKELSKQQAIWNAFGQGDYYKKRVKREKQRWRRLKKKLEKQKAPMELKKFSYSSTVEE